MMNTDEHGLKTRIYTDKGNYLRRLICLFLTVLLCLSHSLVWAISQITNAPASINHKQSVTISGSGFGAHADNSPSDASTLAVKFDDFESGTVGQNVVPNNGWSQFGGFDDKIPTYTNINQRTGSTKSTYHDLTHANPTFGLYHDPTAQSYVSYWVRLHITLMGTHGGSEPKNYKELKIWGNYQGYYPAIGIEVPSTDPAPNMNMMIRMTASDAEGYGHDWAPSFTNDLWFRREVWIRVTDELGQAFKYWENGVLEINHQGPSDFPGDVGPYFGDWNSRFNRVWFLPFIREGSQGYAQSDDCYIDATQARVEIGNAATWEQCTHREIQIPTAWSSNSITFTANKGSFADGETAYLYVVDENGNVNEQGYPVAFGQGLLGDVNQDGKVDIKDLILVAKDFGKIVGFNPGCDLNGDARVDIKDLIIVAKNFGK